MSGHVSARLDFGLQVNQYLIPHTTTDDHRGFVRCNGRVAVAGERYDVQCAGDGRSDRGVVPNWMWEITPTPGFAGAVLQVAWENAYPDTETLRAWVLAPMAGGQGGEVLADVTAASPIRLEVGEAFARAMPDWTTVRLHMDLPQEGGPVPGATVLYGREQPFHAVATLFYVDPAPPGYTLP